MERIVSLFRIETRMIRPGMTIILGGYETELPLYDPLQNAKGEAFNSCDFEPFLVSWLNSRNRLIAMVSALTEEDLSLKGMQMNGRGELALIELLESWVENERKGISEIFDPF